MIDSDSLERDAGEKPASAFSHPALSWTISDLINAQKEPVGFSIAQFWEVEIKMAAGWLQGLDDLSEIVRNLNLELVSIEPADAVCAAHLPRHHGDPFDRMLIAQARGLTIVTHDKIFGSYAVPVIWASNRDRSQDFAVFKGASS